MSLTLLPQRVRSISGRAWLGLVVGLGVLFRLVQWAWGQPFWTDEASLLLNVASKTARQLMGPLDYAQACPPVHLLLLRGLFVSLGDSSYSLRLASLVLSLVALLVFAVLAWRLLPPVEAILIAAQYAFSDRVIWHATEAKQYTGDSLAVVLLLWIAFGWRTQRGVGARLLVAAGAAAALLWLSHATLFLFGAISLALLPAATRERRGVASWFAANTLFAVSAGALYVLSIRVQRSPALVHMWVDQFVPWAKPATIVPWLARGVIGLCDYPVQGLGGALLTILFICGIAGLRRRSVARQAEQSPDESSTVKTPLSVVPQRPTSQPPRGQTPSSGDGDERVPLELLAALVLPFVFLLVASAFSIFPLNGNRVTFFTVPLILLLAGFGSAYVREKLRGRLGGVGRVTLAVMVLDAFGMAAFHVVKPEPRTHIRPVIEFLEKHHQPGEGIYVIGKGTRSMFLWYWRGQPGPVLCKDEEGPNLPIPWTRYWVVGIYRPKAGIAEMQRDVDYAKSGARELERFQSEGSAAILYQRVGSVQ